MNGISSVPFAILHCASITEPFSEDVHEVLLDVGLLLNTIAGSSVVPILISMEPDAARVYAQLFPSADSEEPPTILEVSPDSCPWKDSVDTSPISPTITGLVAQECSERIGFNWISR